jgi:AcrR family transcriptional regulator
LTTNFPGSPATESASISPAAIAKSSQTPAPAPREHILAKVEEVIAARGYADTTTVEIILQAGVSSKTFYKYFPSKEAAFRAALRVNAERVLARTRSASQSAGSWADRVHASLGALIHFVAANPALARMGVIDIQTAGPDAVAEFQRWLRRYADTLAPLPGEQLATLSPRPGVADQIAGGIAQLLYDALHSEPPIPLAPLLPDMLEIAMAPYVGPTQAAAYIAQRISNQTMGAHG